MNNTILYIGTHTSCPSCATIALDAYMTDWNKTARPKRFINYSTHRQRPLYRTYVYARETVRTPRYRDRDHKIMTYVISVYNIMTVIIP